MSDADDAQDGGGYGNDTGGDFGGDGGYNDNANFGGFEGLGTGLGSTAGWGGGGFSDGYGTTNTGSEGLSNVELARTYGVGATTGARSDEVAEALGNISDLQDELSSVYGWGAAKIAAAVALATVIGPAGVLAGLKSAKSTYEKATAINDQLAAIEQTRPGLFELATKQTEKAIEASGGDINNIDWGGSGGEGIIASATSIAQNIQSSSPAQISEMAEEVKMDNLSSQITETMGQEAPTTGEYQANPAIQQAQDALTNMTAELKEIGEIRELSDLSGEVTANEKRLLDEMEQNSINTLTETVNDQTSDYLKSQIASLVSRGVLQGGVGEAAISKIGETALEQVRMGTTDISTARMAQELQIIDQNKTNQMELWKWGDTVDLQKAELGIEAASQTGQLGVYESKLKTEWDQFNTEIESDWQKSKLTGLTNLYGIETGAETTLAGQATTASIAQSQADAAEDASKWSAWGNIAGSVIDLWD